MEEEDDDFYGGAGPRASDANAASFGDGDAGQEATVKDEQMGEQEDGDQEDEDEDEDEDDIEFTLEKPQGGVKTEPAAAATTTTARRSAPSQSHDQPSQQRQQPAQSNDNGTSGNLIRPSSRASQPPSQANPFTHAGKEGSAYPVPHASTLDVNSTPSWPLPNNTSKPITHLDIDADLAEHSKPWRLPGTDTTDFFNYGFDEYTWTQYCVKQQSMADGIKELKEADAGMKAMFGGGAAPGAPGGPNGMPPGMPGMPGMPDMEQMMQQMMASGVNPQNMDFNQFMQLAGGAGGPGGGPGGAFGGGGGFDHSMSPAPQQGFQPPSGPQGQQGGGGGFGMGGMGMDGYSAQQMAIMQNDPSGGGGGRGRGRRGRGGGFY